MGHPLNIESDGAVALAKATGEAPLFQGNDFNQTDVPPALA